MKRKLLRFFLPFKMLVFLTFFTALVGRGQDIYVSPTGKDNNPGTMAQPFGTLVHARDVVRERNKTNSGNIVVWLFGGKYVLNQTLVFNVGDGAKAGNTITYRKMPNEVPVICSDVLVTNWKKLEGRQQGLPASAEGKIWTAPVPKGIRPFYTLYNSNGILPRARTTALTNLRTSNSTTVTGSRDLHNTIILPKEYLDSVFYPMHAEISTVGYAGWTMNILPVESIDVNTSTVKLGAFSSYIMAQPHANYVSPQSVWVENTFAGLNEPGKWLYNPDENLIYYWPKEQAPGNDIAIPQLTELIKVEGNIDSLKDTPVEGLIFKGLTFAHGDRYISSGLTGLGLQHDWERYDASTAMLRFRGTENCAIDECHFVNSGGAGIRLDLYNQKDKITNNEIANLGGTGILLVGYGPGTKDVSRDNNISDNLIHNIGTIWWHTMGIFIWQSGHNLVAHNTLYNLPFIGIGITGRINWDPKGVAEASRTIRWSEIRPVRGIDSWDLREPFLHGRENVIEHNDISTILEKMNDGNAIYVSGTGKGNIIRYNYIHDIPSAKAGQAIRCDDDQNETTIESNIIYHFGSFGTAFSIKGRNYIINNVVVSPLGAVRWGMVSVEPSTIVSHSNNLAANNDVAAKAALSGATVLHNIFYATQENQPFVNTALLKQNASNIKFDGNLYYSATNRRSAQEYLNWAHSQGMELNSVEADPQFVDLANRNFDLKPSSPAIRAGFVPFQLDAGIRKQGNNK